LVDFCAIERFEIGIIGNTDVVALWTDDHAPIAVIDFDPTAVSRAAGRWKRHNTSAAKRRLANFDTDDIRCSDGNFVNLARLAGYRRCF